MFEAAVRGIKKAGLTKLPSVEKLKAELGGLAARKATLLEKLRKIQREEKRYDTYRRNVDMLLRQNFKIMQENELELS